MATINYYPAAGGGSGTVTSVVAGTNITNVDATNPAAPIVNAATQFGSDTTILLPNSTPANVTALELISSLSTNTAGSEVSQWLIKLLRAGAQVSAYLLTPNGLTTDTTGTTWVLTPKFAGSAVGTITFNSSGQILINGTQTAGGAILQNNGTTIFTARAGSAGGPWIGAVPFQEAQWTNAASANDFTPPTTGSGGNVTGTTTMNRINGNLANFGQRIWLRNTSNMTFANGVAAGSGFLPMSLQGGVDFVATANSILNLRLVADNSGGGNPTWQEMSRRTP